MVASSSVVFLMSSIARHRTCNYHYIRALVVMLLMIQSETPCIMRQRPPARSQFAEWFAIPLLFVSYLIPPPAWPVASCSVSFFFPHRLFFSRTLLLFRCFIRHLFCLLKFLCLFTLISLLRLCYCHCLSIFVPFSLFTRQFPFSIFIFCSLSVPPFLAFSRYYFRWLWLSLIPPYALTQPCKHFLTRLSDHSVVDEC
jgi:hypothetical protein